MTLLSRLSDLATRTGTELKALRTLINGNSLDLSSLNTTAKSSLVAAINEVKADAGAAINDTAPSSSTTYSSSKVEQVVVASIQNVVGAAPSALDTLAELATALGDNQNFAASVTTSLAQRVAVTSQTFTAGEKAQALQNIGAIAASAIGDPETNLVAVFEAALV